MAFKVKKKNVEVKKIKESKEIESIDLDTLANKIERLKNKTFDIQITALPSMWKPYPIGSRIFAKTFSYYDISRLSEIQLPLDKQYEIMLEGVVAEGFEALDITLHDFIYIGVMRKLASINAPQFIIPYVCPKCKKAKNKLFGFIDLGFDGFDEEVTGFPITVNFFTIGTMEFSPITVRKFMWLVKNDYFYIKDIEGNILKTTRGENVKNVPAYIASHSSTPFASAYNSIKNVSSEEDIVLLNEIEEKLYHGLQPLIFKCDTLLSGKKYSIDKNEPVICGQEIEADLIGGESIIIPFRTETESIADRIHFSKKRDS